MSNISGNTYDIIADQGSTMVRVLTLKTFTKSIINIENYVGRMQIRYRSESREVIKSLTTENGGIQIDGVKGTITLLIKPAEMAQIPAETYVYDVEVEDTETSETTRVLQGKFVVRPEVTR